MKAIVVDYAKSSIVLSSAFAKKAFTPGTAEYQQLMAVRRDFPDFRLVTRQFKTNTKQEHYRGLTYDFMREYLTVHDEAALAEFEGMVGVSKCHSLSKRYPTIKAWFLERYPNVTEFGMTEEELSKWRAKLAKGQEAEEPNSEQSAA